MTPTVSITAARQIPCSKEEFQKILKALQVPDSQHGFSAEWDKTDGLYLFAENSGNEQELPDDVVDSLADLLVSAGIEYLQFGVSLHGSRPIPDSSGGYNFRIYRDGEFVYEETKWPDHDSLKDDEFVCTRCHIVTDIENSVKIGGKKGELICEKCADERDPNDEDADDNRDDYISREECKREGKHLTSCDKDGYCNFCGEQEE